MDKSTGLYIYLDPIIRIVSVVIVVGWSLNYVDVIVTPATPNNTSFITEDDDFLLRSAEWSTRQHMQTIQRTDHKSKQNNYRQGRGLICRENTALKP